MRRIVLISFLLLTVFVQAQIPSRPNPPRLYNNLSSEVSDFISASEAQTIEGKLQQFSNETSNQICVVVVDDLNGMDANSFATQLGQAWGVGQKDKNNGIVFLIKPTGGNGGRDVYLAIGYGLEGAIPDLAVSRILDDEFYPNVKQGLNYQAVDGVLDKLMKLAKGEINVKDYTRHARSQNPPHWITILIIIVIVIIILRVISKGGGGGGTTYWGGGFGNSSWGGSSWGGSSGGSSGGWGGFGGGSFGGGGSGGKW